ncbi:MAG: TonB-dependent receptor [Proteobacteria bacterium]|nr:TonB-dependent receptor [Pseudomonadota bacterium]
MSKVPAARNHVLSSAIAIALITPTVPPAAFGAEGLEEVIVTAQRREESVQDTPVFVTPLRAEDLVNRNIRNTEDLMSNVAGIGGFTSPGARGATSLIIRGVSAGNGANLSSDPAVGLYYDGVYMGKMMASSLDVAEFERMEIMRGPQGSLYGRNATAGAVSWITRKPSGEAGLRTTASYGNYNEILLKINADAPALGEVGTGPGRVALGAGFQVRQRDGWVDNKNGGPDFDEIDRHAWRIAANWQPIDAVTVDYGYDRSELDEVGPLQTVTAFTPVYDNPAAPQARLDRIPALQRTLAAAQFFATIPGADPRIASRWIPSLNATIADYQAAAASGEERPDRGSADALPTNDAWADGHTLNVDWHAGELGLLGDVNFKSITGFRELETYVRGDLENIDSRLDSNGIGAYNDLTHLTLAQIYGGTVQAGFPPVASPAVNSLWNFIDILGTNHSYQDTRSKYEQFSQELQLIGSTAQFDYLLGVMYFDDEGEYTRNAVFAAPLSGKPPQRYENDTTSWAYYAHGSYRFGSLDDRLVLTGGLRYTTEDKGIVYDYGAFLTPFASVPAMATSLDDSFDNLSYDGSLTYHFTDTFNAFVRYATGYRSGGFNGEVFANSYDEETVDQWEIGMKSEWLGRRLRLNASVYQYDAKDLQQSVIRVVNSSITSALVNAGEASRWGADVEILAAPIEDLTLSLGWSYINGDFDKFPATCTGGTTPVCLNTDDLARRSAPEHQLSLTADWTFARTDSGDFDLYLQYNYQGESYAAAITTGIMGSGAAAIPYVYDRQVLDSRSVLGARLSWNNIPVGNDSLRLTLYGRNLTDDDYPAYGINFGSLGLYTEQYGEPRTYGIEAAYGF